MVNIFINKTVITHNKICGVKWKWKSDVFTDFIITLPTQDVHRFAACCTTGQVTLNAASFSLCTYFWLCLYFNLQLFSILFPQLQHLNCSNRMQNEAHLEWASVIINQLICHFHFLLTPCILFWVMKVLVLKIFSILMFIFVSNLSFLVDTDNINLHLYDWLERSVENDTSRKKIVFNLSAIGVALF